MSDRDPRRPAGDDRDRRHPRGDRGERGHRVGVRAGLLGVGHDRRERPVEVERDQRLPGRETSASSPSRPACVAGVGVAFGSVESV
ncbi:hypothetical protein GCM10023238_29260 [Streptomyces heliomycini]